MKRVLMLTAAAMIALPAAPALAGDTYDSGYYGSGSYYPYDDYYSDPYYRSYDSDYYYSRYNRRHRYGRRRGGAYTAPYGTGGQGPGSIAGTYSADGSQTPAQQGGMRGR